MLKIQTEIEGKMVTFAECETTAEAIRFCREFCQNRPNWYYVDFGDGFVLEWRDLLSNPEEEP